MILTAVIFVASLVLVTSAQAADKPNDGPATVETSLHGEWQGGACVGELMLRSDGHFERQHYTPGNIKLTGTWTVRWSSLPPTLVLACKTSDDPLQVGKVSQVKLVQLDGGTLACQDADGSTVHYVRLKNDNEKGPDRHLPELTNRNSENVNLVKGFIVTGTMKQVIGNFSSHGRPVVGDTFEIALDNLPHKAIQFTSKNNGSHYVPFSAPLIIERVKQGEKVTGPSRTAIHLSAVDTDSKLLIQVISEGLEKGSKVRILLYRDGSFLGSMAEAEGVLR